MTAPTMQAPITLEKFEVRNRFTNAVQFTAEIECAPDASVRIKLGLAVRWARKSGADLRDADLSDANLSDADLSGYLRGADLRGANLSDAGWIPKIENIHQRVYGAAKRRGALDMATWHKGGDFCGTTHCRAGWVNHLAGDGGRVLEGVYGPGVAAAMIYMVSDPTMEKVPDWLASNAEAMADMKRLAEQVSA